MELIFQFGRILAVCFAGELLAQWLPLGIPASVYGLLLMLAALKGGLFRPEQVKTAGGFLTGILPLLFVPAAVGVMEAWQEIREMLGPCALAVVPVTFLVIGVSGRVTQRVLRKQRKGGTYP